MGTVWLPPNQARQQQAAGWGRSAAAVGLVSWLPESDEWSRGRKKPTKVSLILMRLHFFFFFFFWPTIERELKPRSFFFGRHLKLKDPISLQW